MQHSDYSEKVMDHFNNPRNMGEIRNPDGESQVGNPTCGDMMQIQIKVEDGKIKEAKFKTFGCVAAIATSSISTEMIIGKTLEEAEKLTNDAVALALDGLPAHKRHCSVLAAEAIQAAIQNYREHALGGAK
ncbi:MAG: Fe-S cluster assembly scaffold protein NifU [Nitrospirae bacterium CG_4_9_14_3_um_filter_53_35]|nr:MAG: Fe-S cluster assembly scaffold protein NifU [Nitrospirae bacterium CG2_30_53_67]PIS36952.1 MAG: Fe-S cluster assembly scaffold protein NifU [Nitrospirae bacterium CG08_land_8_20_14_0_20_52_24]PIV83118.1 MAG: Fe-S cluster assembly scaffold protein NifU [Nitrospirae bacterium CG17_big_fil_post_rev_8_21_14_2_50_50_9]PIX85055.1 MAG: Fe-S cluster assembly scaffold protein NifU [Nitrospirae bacterium CG_4_10_14_3_um_filter_53_41]PJA74469.1 MAG: Fe-S cluster assembly scaffold protein NifU [Nit